MSKEEMEIRLEELQKDAFDIQMKDHWLGEDFNLMQKINKEIVDLEKRIKEME